MEKKLFKIVQENIKMILKCMGMSQAELSKKIKKDPATIHRWINGSRAITLDNLEILCESIGISIKNIINPNLKIEVKQQLIVINDD